MDTVLFRDVVERYGISRVAALRWLIRQCLRNPAGAFSVLRFYKDLKIQGHGIAKDAVHALFGRLTDAFWVSAVPVATDSERRRNSNPRKIYPADPALIGAFDTSGRSNIGHALETVVFNELERRKARVSYVKTPDGFEVDFYACHPTGREELVQVRADPSAPETRERGLRALAKAARQAPRAMQHLLVLTQDQAAALTVPGIKVQPVYEWLLERPQPD